MPSAHFALEIVNMFFKLDKKYRCIFFTVFNIFHSIYFYFVRRAHDVEPSHDVEDLIDLIRVEC